MVKQLQNLFEDLANSYSMDTSIVPIWGAIWCIRRHPKFGEISVDGPEIMSNVLHSLVVDVEGPV